MTEWNNLKYRLMEEIGENMDIVVFRHHFETGLREYYTRNHSDMDGTGAFCDVLSEADGVKFAGQPMRSRPVEPSAIKKFVLAYQFWKLTRKPSPRWKESVDFTLTGPAESFSFCTFDSASTKRFSSYCAPRDRSLTALLLKTLDTVAAREFLIDQTARTWVIPTNMRGAVTDQFQLGNYSTSTLIRTSNTTTVEEIYTVMRKFLDQGLHWGSWLFTNLPKYMSTERYRKFVHTMGNAAVGSLSNMGQAPYPGMTYPTQSPAIDSYIWGGCPPSSRVVPLNATSGIWSDRLTLTMKTHPSLKCDAKQTSLLMEKWLAELERYIPELRCKVSIQTIPMKAVYQEQSP